MKKDPANIKHYKKDGFVHVCDVRENEHWYYVNIDESVMYSSHRSWIYFIVVGDTIYKIGETGNPLGIKSSHKGVHGAQPKKGSESRLGRYRNGDRTDANIRRELWETIRDNGNVSIWAKACPIQHTEELVGGRKVQIINTIHKDLEMVYLDYYVKNVGTLPPGNRMRK